MQERLGQQRRDEIAGDELAGAVDEEQRSASPSQAMPISARLALDRLDDVAAILLDERVRLVVGKCAVDFEAQPCRPCRAGARRACGATMPAMPLPASSTTLNGLMIDRIDERHHVIRVIVDARLACDRAVPVRSPSARHVPLAACRGCR